MTRNTRRAQFHVRAARLALAALILAACIQTAALAQEQSNAASRPVGAKASGPAGAELADRWVYLATNFQVDQNVTDALALIERSAKAGYNGMVVADSKFMMWDRVIPKYFDNVRKVRDSLRSHGMKCIASVCPVGYSGGIMGHDPNLAEGLPVIDAPFVARGGKLVPSDDSAAVANGSFEQYKGNAPAGWSFIDQPGKISFVDTDVKFEGKASLRMQDIGISDSVNGHGRAHQAIKVRPFRYYHVSAEIKTQDFEAADEIRIAILAKDGTSLNYYQPAVKKTQDWRRADITFNSLEFDEVRLYVGVWGGKGGKLWIDDVKIEPGGFNNVIRRDGAPLKIAAADGKTTYVEGKDFARVADPLMGMDPYAGAFTVWHKQPEIAVPAGSGIADGQTVLASYYHPAIVHSSQVMCCLCEPKVYDILRWQIQQVHKNLSPDGYFLQHDEIRSQGYDASCVGSGKTPGANLADNLARCVKMVRDEDAGKPLYVWSDMFDPNHNAKKAGRYYLVKGVGPWYESWKDFPQSLVVVNWAQNDAKTLDFFAAMGNEQILAGYYDADPKRITQWLKLALKVKGVRGVMYTTWRNNYKDMETFAGLIGGNDR